MADALDVQFRRAWRQARRDDRPVTHWLVDRHTRDALRAASRGQLSAPGEVPMRYMGLPLYVTGEDVGPTGFLLREGDPPDEARELELRRQLAQLQRNYQELTRPIIDELVKIEARKPPRPVLFPDTLGGMRLPR